MNDASVISTRSHPEAPVRARALARPRTTLLNPGLLCVGAAAILSLLGIIAIATTKPDLAMRQSIFLLVGVGAAAIIALPHYTWARRLSFPLLGIVILLLLFVLIPAVPDFLVRPKNGARRWINLGLTDFQPSEIAKIAFVLALANWLRFKKNYRRLFGLIPPFLLTFVPMGLVLIEPDLGTALLFLPTLFAMLIAAGAKMKHVILIVVLGVSAAPAMYPMLRPHQQERIQAMVGQITGDERYIDTIGFQARQAQILVGSGRIGGVGGEHAGDLLAHNSLPYHYNDMIFAVVATRWGLLGGLGILGLYLAFLIGGVLAAGFCREAFGRLVAVGVVTVVFAQMTVNIGMTIGLLPITGMNLPFVSYGGSSLVTNWLIVGLLYNISMRPPRFMEREPFEFGDEEGE